MSVKNTRKHKQTFGERLKKRDAHTNTWMHDSVSVLIYQNVFHAEKDEFVHVCMYVDIYAY
jgi:hypothetical protein